MPSLGPPKPNFCIRRATKPFLSANNHVYDVARNPRATFSRRPYTIKA